MKFITSLAEIADQYDVFFCDVWGVVHNGVAGYEDAIRILKTMRQKGKCVVLVTNSPRPHDSVETQVAGFGIDGSCYDAIVTSGDVTRSLIENSARRIFHIGTELELVLFDGLDVELVEEFEASCVVCTGLYDDSSETPQDYQEMLMRIRSRNLPFICANPDIVVERGNKMVWCAGALGREYSLMGGRTLVAGKPHRPIYELALEKAQAIKGPVDKNRILAIGDGMLTDIKGAVEYGLDALFIAGGIHEKEYVTDSKFDRDRLAAFIDKQGHHPVAIMPSLV